MSETWIAYAFQRSLVGDLPEIEVAGPWRSFIAARRAADRLNAADTRDGEPWRIQAIRAAAEMLLELPDRDPALWVWPAIEKGAKS